MLIQLKSDTGMHVKVHIHVHTPVWETLFKLANVEEMSRDTILTEELFLGLM